MHSSRAAHSRGLLQQQTLLKLVVLQGFATPLGSVQLDIAGQHAITELHRTAVHLKGMHQYAIMQRLSGQAICFRTTSGVCSSSKPSTCSTSPFTPSASLVCVLVLS